MIAAEAMLFLTSCLLGAALGVVYDLFRAVRLLFRQGLRSHLLRMAFSLQSSASLSLSFFSIIPMDSLEVFC